MPSGLFPPRASSANVTSNACHAALILLDRPRSAVDGHERHGILKSRPISGGDTGDLCLPIEGKGGHLKRFVQVMTSILCWFASLQAASADPIGLFQGVRVCEDISVAGCGTQVDYFPLDPTAPFSVTDTYSSALLDITFSADTRAGFGSFGAGVSASFDGGFGFRSNFVVAGSASLERLTIDAPGLAGQNGLLMVSYELDGTMDSSGLSGARVGVGNCVGGAGSIQLVPSADGATTCDRVTFDAPAVSHVAVLPFVFGTPFDWHVNFFTLANFQGVGVGTATVDYLNSLTLVGLQPTLAGVAVGDATFSSESGTRYSVRGVVPEPASLLLLGIGGLSSIAWSRTRSRNRV